jgi:hypothetical protein
MDEEVVAAREVEDEILSSTPDSQDTLAGELFRNRPGARRGREPGVVDDDGGDRPAGQDRREASANGPHLRQLRHGSSVAAALEALVAGSGIPEKVDQ